MEKFSYNERKLYYTATLSLLLYLLKRKMIRYNHEAHNGEGRGQAMMYTILLAEDESLIRSNIKLQIESCMHGYTVALEASSGDEAIELLHTSEPDIVMTDIRMPGADGLQVIRTAKQLYPDIPCIVLTGFQEFDIVKEALELGTISYILKPVNTNKLIEALQRAAQLIKRTNRYDAFYPLIELEPFFIQAIEGDQSDVEAFAQKAQQCIPFTVNSSPRIALAIDNFVMREQLFDLLSKFEGIVFCTRYLAFAAIITLPKHWSRQQMNEEIRQLSWQLKQADMKTAPAIGISSPFNSWQEAPSRFDEAFGYYAQRFYKGSPWVAGPEADAAAVTLSVSELEDTARMEADKVELSISTSNWSNLENGLAGWFGKAQESRWPVAVVHHECARMLRKILYAFTEDQLELLGLANWSAMQWVKKKRTIAELQYSVIQFLQDIKAKTEHYSGNVQSIVAKVQAIIERDYGDSGLSIVEIADQLYISASHLSTIFKKKTGVPFSQYVKELRLDKAKKLLEEDRLKVYEIASAVGYINEKSFSRAFRRELGDSPQNYKRKSGLL